MWYIYSFKLAYAQDNSFELRVNTNWTCSEFVEKVTSIARLTFPSISITDVMHVTESWNQTGNPNYNNLPAEENTPIPQSYQTIGERYNTRYFQYLHFYIYFRDECQSIQLRHSRNESRTLEQQYNAYCEYYYDLWIGEQEDIRLNNANLRQNNDPSYILLPTGSYNTPNSDTQQPTWGLQWGWTGMNSQYAGGVTADSQAVTLDDMMYGYDTLLPRNLLDDMENENINESPSLYDEDLFTPQRLRNELSTNNSIIWNNIPTLPINNMIFNNIEFDLEQQQPSYTPLQLISSDCCVCFTEGIQCVELQHCNHSVCQTCYVGVFTRLNGHLDLRCPLCRIDNSFSSDIYHQITGTHV